MKQRPASLMGGGGAKAKLRLDKETELTRERPGKNA